MLVKESGFKTTYKNLVQGMERTPGLTNLWRNSRATLKKHLGTIIDLCMMPESEGVFTCSEAADIDSRIVALNVNKLVDVGTAKLEELVARQWPSDVSAVGGRGGRGGGCAPMCRASARTC